MGLKVCCQSSDRSGDDFRVVTLDVDVDVGAAGSGGRVLDVRLLDDNDYSGGDGSLLSSRPSNIASITHETRQKHKAGSIINLKRNKSHKSKKPNIARNGDR